MKRTPIFRKILIPLMILVVIEICILVFALFGQGLIRQLNDNQKDVLQGRVKARKNYLESVMVNDWMNLSGTVQHITQTAQELLDQGQISLDTLDDSSASCEALLTASAGSLLDMLRLNRVTGAYLIINTEDLTGTLGSDNLADKPGLYLRDADPMSIASERNEDILIELSPMKVVRQLHIGTDADWDVRFRFTGERRDFYQYLYYPFQMAYEYDQYRWQDMGYWAAPDGLSQRSDGLLSYSVPLVLKDGTVIGVLGAELTQSYLARLLPYDELNEEGLGGYFLAQYHEDNGTFSHVFGFGSLDGLTEAQAGRFLADAKAHYLHMEPLRIYNSNTPFSSQQWVLAGILPNRTIQSYSRTLFLAMLIAVGFALVIGLLASVLLSYMLQRPVAHLAQEMRSKDPRSGVQLSPTGILELDQMSDEVMRLSQDVLESGRKFSTIIEMASIHLAGFQIDHASNSLFLTERFFAIFNRPEIEDRGMSVETFRETMEQFRPYCMEQGMALDGQILRIPEEGKQRFIKVRIRRVGEYTYGLAEDVTQSLLEKQIIKYERDHDSLTNLHNRRAFRRQVQAVLDDTDSRITIGALVMIDLDNLKYINDTYGHDYGDRYLKQAAAAIARCGDGNVFHARISGDEFNVFFYGYGDRQEIEAKLENLRQAFRVSTIQLPDGKTQRLRATGGIAWYPQDSASFEDLCKYADYAMYRAKRTNKGQFQHFDREMFLGQDVQLRNNAALTRMIEERLLYYAFPPIVDARTGDIFAYAALLRPDVVSYFYVKDAMDTARREGKLSQIEELTWTLSLQSFADLIQEGRIDEDSYLFINSIPNQRLSEKTEQELSIYYGYYGSRLVMELTEDEQMDVGIWLDKERKHRALGGHVALDDYGSGYNTEKALLTFTPDYIKVDLEIVRNIHLNQDKQAMMEYIANYAHARGKKIIAEGVETVEEVKMVVALGADYLQGYFFARPMRTPEGISEAGKALLRELNQRT